MDNQKTNFSRKDRSVMVSFFVAIFIVGLSFYFYSENKNNVETIDFRTSSNTAGEVAETPDLLDSRYSNSNRGLLGCDEDDETVVQEDANEEAIEADNSSLLADYTSGYSAFEFNTKTSYFYPCA